jgi:hypothetical protein
MIHEIYGVGRDGGHEIFTFHGHVVRLDNRFRCASGTMFCFFLLAGLREYSHRKLNFRYLVSKCQHG